MVNMKRVYLPEFDPDAEGNQYATLARRYTIMKHLGEGGLALTYLARDNRNKKTVVIKELYTTDCYRRIQQSHKQLKGSRKERRKADGASVRTAQGNLYDVLVKNDAKNKWAELLQRFKEEYNLLSELNGMSDYVVRCIEYIEANETRYMVLEHIDGPTLARLVDAQRFLAPPQVLEYITKVGEVLHALHTRLDGPYLHLDVQPANIIIARGLDEALTLPKLIDFGSAQPFTRHPISESVPIVSHTKHFSAPEVLARKRYALGASTTYPGPYSDVYSLAATCFYCLTGEFHDGPNQDSAWLNLQRIEYESGYIGITKVLKTALEPKVEIRKELTASVFVKKLRRITSNTYQPRQVNIPPRRDEPTATPFLDDDDGVSNSRGIKAGSSTRNTGPAEHIEPTEVLMVSKPSRVSRIKAWTKQDSLDRVKQYEYRQRINLLLSILLFGVISIAIVFFIAQVSIAIMSVEVPAWGLIAGVGLPLSLAVGYLLLRRVPQDARMNGLHVNSELTVDPPIRLRGLEQIVEINGAKLEFTAMPRTGWPRLKVLETKHPVFVNDDEADVGAYADRTDLGPDSIIVVGGEIYSLQGRPQIARNYRPRQKNSKSNVDENGS
jgi:serine/threonine protein kinase